MVNIQRAEFTVNFNQLVPRFKRGFSSVNIFSNKETYITHKWSLDFPSHSMLTYEEITSLSSRSRDISVWYKRTSEEFVLYREAPEWFLAAGSTASEWTSEIQAKYALVKNMNSDFLSQTNAISLRAKAEMASLEAKHKASLVDVLSETPELVINLINSQMLPYETHLKAFEFNTKEEAKNFIDKETLLFKTNTYKKFISGELSSSSLVEILFEK